MKSQQSAKCKIQTIKQNKMALLLWNSYKHTPPWIMINNFNPNLWINGLNSNLSVIWTTTPKQSQIKQGNQDSTRKLHERTIKCNCRSSNTLILQVSSFFQLCTCIHTKAHSLPPLSHYKCNEWKILFIMDNPFINYINQKNWHIKLSKMKYLYCHVNYFFYSFVASRKNLYLLSKERVSAKWEVRSSNSKIDAASTTDWIYTNYNI